jgi:hypothetical protein
MLTQHRKLPNVKVPPCHIQWPWEVMRDIMYIIEATLTIYKRMDVFMQDKGSNNIRKVNKPGLKSIIHPLPSPHKHQCQRG